MTAARQNPAFLLIAGQSALDLVNTLDWRFRPGAPEELLSSYGDLLRFAEQSKLLTAAQVRQLERTTSESEGARVLVACRDLRESAAEVFYAGLAERSPSDAAVKKLERRFKAAREAQTLRWSRSRLQWAWGEIHAAPDFPLLLLSRCVSNLLLDENMQRLRACDNPECRWLFLDTSKNHTRRWCDMKLCGNRMKARRFKAQRKP